MRPASGLFDEPPRVEGTEDPDARTAEQRRRDRHLAAIHRGVHPLSIALRRSLALHPDAPRDGRREGDGTPRCGGCVHRTTVDTGSGRRWPKCLHGAYSTTRRAFTGETGRHVVDGRVTFLQHPRATRGAGTDVRAWWPACCDYREDPNL